MESLEKTEKSAEKNFSDPLLRGFPYVENLLKARVPERFAADPPSAKIVWI